MNLPKYGTTEWRAYQYDRAKLANRGHNYAYWNDKHYEMLESGWSLYEFDGNTRHDRQATTSELIAKDVVSKLRSDGCSARIVAGLVKTQQRRKHFSVIYKKKGQNYSGI